MRTNPVKRKARKPTSAYRKKRLAKDRDMWALYGLKKPAKPRYVGLQGVLWFLVSQAVRREDFALYGGLCVDGCGGKVSDWREAHAGHYQTAGRASTRFDRRNLALQLPACNQAQMNGDVSKSAGFAKEIDRRYGAGTADQIIEKSKEIFVINDDWLRQEINKYLPHP